MNETQKLNFNEQTSLGPRYQLEVFEGPLDLLLKLIARNKVDIFDIPIALILDQYMEYVNELDKTDSEIAGDFIAMAAELMLIKSKMLLPGSADPAAPDPRAQLVSALMDYKKAKEAAIELNGLYQVYSGRMAKESEEIDVDKTFVAPQELEFLAKAFERIEKRRRLMDLAKTDEPEKNLKTIATAKVTPIHEKVVSMLKYMLKKKAPVSFEELMAQSRTRSELVASFIALLQLIRRGQIAIVSDDPENPLLEINHERDKFAATNN
ncbi:MAG: segregation/condensation protein A [Clostridia bacterium]|nr:segregation/condensation protein A [Clostridia bacterium]